MLRATTLAALCLLGATADQTAVAAPLFGASAPGCNVQASTTVFCPLFTQTFDGSFPGHTQSAAHAGPGNLGALGSSSTVIDGVAIAGSGTFSRGVGGSAFSIFDDLLITGGPPGASGFIQGTINLHVSGFFRAGATLKGPGTPSANARAQASLNVSAVAPIAPPCDANQLDPETGEPITCPTETQLGAAHGDIGVFYGTSTLTGSADATVNTSLVKTGIFANAATGSGGFVDANGGSVSQTFESAPFQFPIGQAFALAISLQVIADSSVTNTLADPLFASNEAIASALADFSDTVAFPFSGTAFNLPSGFTLNSAQANIVNNQFGLQVTSVPEPSAFALVAIGLVALLCAPKRRRVVGLS